MDVSYANSRIRKICTDAKVAQKELGRDGAQTLQERLEQMFDAENLETLRFAAGTWHELKGDRKGQLACNIMKLTRLVFTPANDPLPIKPDGGLDWTQVTAVENIEIVDYH